MSGRVYLGVDPGLQGAIASISAGPPTASPMPIVSSPKGRDQYDIAGILRALEWLRGSETFAVIEKLQAMPMAQAARSPIQTGTREGARRMRLVRSRSLTLVGHGLEKVCTGDRGTLEAMEHRGGYDVPECAQRRPAGGWKDCQYYLAGWQGTGGKY